LPSIFGYAAIPFSFPFRGGRQAWLIQKALHRFPEEWIWRPAATVRHPKNNEDDKKGFLTLMAPVCIINAIQRALSGSLSILSRLAATSRDAF
jgi:hypothetical protein